MKYVIVNEEDGTSLHVWPSDRSEPDNDYWLNFMAVNDRLDEAASVDVLASQLFEFVEWLKTWCPPFRPREVSE